MSDTSFEVATEVEVPIEAAWAVLADLRSYQDWHPQIASASGELSAGSVIRMTAAGPQPASLDLRVVDVRAPHLLITEGGDPEHVFVQHRWELSELTAGRTRVVDRETFMGPAASETFAQYAGAMQAQLEPILAALKSAMEAS